MLHSQVNVWSNVLFQKTFLPHSLNTIHIGRAKRRPLAQLATFRMLFRQKSLLGFRLLMIRDSDFTTRELDDYAIFVDFTHNSILQSVEHN